MLDNTFIHNKSSTNVEVNIEQANVHDAARLLGEMETKARERFVDSLTLKNNIIEGKVFRSIDMNGVGFDLAFMINGKRTMTHVNLEPEDEIDQQKKLEKIANTLAKALAVEMLISLDNNNQRVFFQ